MFLGVMVFTPVLYMKTKVMMSVFVEQYQDRKHAGLEKCTHPRKKEITIWKCELG